MTRAVELKKRSYNSENRQAQAQQTRNRIIDSAKKLFATNGFECVTIDTIAQNANVSAPTIYCLFQSKRGILRALMDEALPPQQFEALVKEALEHETPERRIRIGAKIARLMYDAEKAQMDLIRGASVIAPEFKEIEKEREERRYKRQEVAILKLIKEDTLKSDLTVTKARDILWAFTGRDMYRMFVIERGWTSDDYESWLGDQMVHLLLK